MKFMYITTESIYSSTSSNIRNVSLIKGLHELGHEIHIVCSSANEENNRYFNTTIDRMGHVSIFNKQRVKKRKINDDIIRINSKLSFKNFLLERIKKIILKLYNKFRVYDPYRFYVIYADIDKIDTSDVDIIISSSEPRSSHLLAEKIIKKHNPKIPWIQYWGDPMSCDITSESIFNFYSEYKERCLLKKAYLVVYTNQLASEYMKRKYTKMQEKIADIPTACFNIDEQPLNQSTDDSKFTIGYFGDYNSKWRDIKPLWDYANKHAENKLFIAGNSDLKLTPTKNIEVHPRMNKLLVEKLEQDVNLLIIIENTMPKDIKKIDRAVQIPGKIYHYAMSSKPILVLCESDRIKNCFLKYNRFYFCKNEISSIENTIETIRLESEGILFGPIEEFLPVNVAKRLMSEIIKGKKYGVIYEK